MPQRVRAPLVVDEIDLVQGDHSPLDAQNLQDIEVFTRLRHDPVVGGDHEQRHVDRTHPSDHGFDEALVTWHIDDGRRLIEVGETQFDRDPPLLLLAGAIRVDTGQRMYQLRLAMVDVTGRADDGMCQFVSFLSARFTGVLY